MTRSGAAVPVGTDVRALLRRIARARDSFLSCGVTSETLRPIVAQSWQRSMDLGLDPGDWGPPLDLDRAELEAYRQTHPLAAAMPVVRRLLVDQAAEAGGLIVAVSDQAGRLLWVEGAAALRRRAEDMRFVEGARWSEDVAGTNAPGTALALGEPVQIFAAEHLAPLATPWSCAAAPVRGPDGRLLGTIDVTGGDEVAGVQSMLLVRATVAAVEAELRNAHGARPPAPGGRSAGRTTPPPSAPPAVGAVARMEVLGRSGAAIGRNGITHLRLRHAEIILLLSEHPEGLSGEQLTDQLFEHRTASVTLRADLSRLRPLLAAVGDLRLTASPYRLVGDLTTDVDDVQRLINRGSVRRALTVYHGPILPESCAPGIEALRRRLADDVRACLIACHDPDLLWTYANRPDAAADLAVWQACRRLLPRHSPRVPIADTRIQELNREYGR